MRVKIIQQNIVFIDLIIQKNYSNILLIIILMVKFQMKKFHLHSMLDVEVVKQQSVNILIKYTFFK
jgi:hypothetical protein